MKSVNCKLQRYFISLIVLLGAGSGFAQAYGFEPVYATVSSDEVNIRAGSGQNFEIIGQLNKAEKVMITGEKFDWYKIKLPQKALCFVHKDYIENGIVRASKLRVRAGSGLNFNVLGMLKKGEVVNILEEDGDWLRIVPPKNCRGWVKKDFLITLPKPPAILEPLPLQQKEEEKKIEAMGIIDDLGKIINRRGTHKLIQGKEILYYLKSRDIDLNLYVYQNVSVKGELLDLEDSLYPVIEVEQINVRQ